MSLTRAQRELTLGNFNTSLGDLYAQLFACQERKRKRLLAVADIERFVDRLDAVVTGCVQQELRVDLITGYMDAGAQDTGGYGEAQTTNVEVGGARVYVRRIRARQLEKPDDFKFVLGLNIVAPALMKQLKAAGWIRCGTHWHPKEVT